MIAALPTETQQIDRVMEAFAVRYARANPGLFASTDTPYVLAFSLVMLSTDQFNPSNKNKMSKADYVRNTKVDGVSAEVLEYFFDQITITPFVFVEDDADAMPTRPELGSSTSSSFFGKASTAQKERAKLDPYHLIAQVRLFPATPGLSADFGTMHRARRTSSASTSSPPSPRRARSRSPAQPPSSSVDLAFLFTDHSHPLSPERHNPPPRLRPRADPPSHLAHTRKVECRRPRRCRCAARARDEHLDVCATGRARGRRLEPQDYQDWAAEPQGGPRRGWQEGQLAQVEGVERHPHRQPALVLCASRSLGKGSVEC